MHFIKSQLGLFVGMGLLIISANFVILWPAIVRSIIDNFFQMSPNGLVYNIWKNTHAQFECKLYYFNWTNPEDINDPSIKPKFQEIGPYTFKGTMQKVNVSLNENGTVSFRLLRKYFFVPEKSKGQLTDKISSIQPVLLSINYIARNWNYLVKKGISITLSKVAHDINFTKTVDELTFKGFDDTLYNVLLKSSFLLGIKAIPADRFGYLYGRNNSLLFEDVHTFAGGKGKETLGQLLEWRHKKHTGLFPGKCGQVRGAMEIFPRLHRGLSDQLVFFCSDYGRTLTFDFNRTEDIEGIEMYRYEASDRIWDNGTKMPENKCFCMGTCQPSGTINISSVFMGAPLFASLPHFYKADPLYLQGIDGLKPNKTKHEMYLKLEPNTGVPYQIVARFQVNILLKPDDTIALFQHVPNVYMPIMWMEQQITMPSSILTILQIVVILPKVIFSIFCITMTIGFFMVTSVLSQTGLKHLRCLFRRKKKPKLPEEMPLQGRNYYKNKPKALYRMNTC